MATDTIFALASGRPPAAISVIRISGPQAHAAGLALAGSLPQRRQAAVRTLRNPADGFVLDEALVLRFDAPASSSGEHVVELHCHGGRAVVDAVLGVLAGIKGLRPAKPGEFTRRAFENGRIDLTEAEGLADLVEAETESQRRAALAVAEGGLRRRIEQWQEQLLALSARAEAEIDYAEEGDVGGDGTLSRECGALATELGEWLSLPRIEPLRDGIRVVIAGPPNAGKSSLLNALTQAEKAIVTELPGTTRDQIEVPLAIDGVPTLLIDTAGLRDSTDPAEQIGVGRARIIAQQADILLWLGEAAEAPEHPLVVLVHSRCDLPDRGKAPPRAQAVSALTGQGVAELASTISAMARSFLPQEDAIALNRRQAAELSEAHRALNAACNADDIALRAEHLRAARGAFDRLSGRAGVEDMLDALFGRFCLGK